MARVKMTEYRAKKILIGDTYRGIEMKNGAKLTGTLRGQWVAKVDQGTKRRFKQGLIAIGSRAKLVAKLGSWKRRGFSRFIVEPFIPHDKKEERYLSLERVRGGIRFMYAKDGGVDVEAHPESVQTLIVHEQRHIEKVAHATKIPEQFLSGIYDAFNGNFLAFLEMNPLVVRKNRTHILDAAALVDSAGVFFARGAWGEADLVKKESRHPAEKRVEELDATTPASLKLSVLNKNGSIFLLLSAGGGSIVIADQAEMAGAEKLIGNYGEYSGGPTREETYLYAREIVQLLVHSKNAKKALVIAGPVANFTDVRVTFLGIIDALSEKAAELRKSKVKVFVRRGGPNEAEGLNLMREFLKRERFLGAVYGSDSAITRAIDEAIPTIC